MDRAMQIIQVIEKNPGIKFREIMRKTGMKNGVLGHYASKLEREGTIKVERSPGQTRFYPLSVSDEDTLFLKNLRQETPKQILTFLLQYGTLSFSELVQYTKKSPATVSFYLSQITKDDIIEGALVNFKKKYHIKNIEKIRSIIDKYHPSLIESSADHLADTFSSL
ncbi:MAG TPA: winged helix-turn-helix transcriptional regulator [Candidatus Nitrosotalea sp.]|nr:winged helix-turn-helix transcriptional regulator [Nitrososphaerota archaeon]HKU33172.1 winged helix-turn-helix transcriptional regulator [Candidatus Nitrosotalea sp.]